MSNVATSAVECAQAILDNKLTALDLRMTTPTEIAVGVGTDLRAVLKWANFLRVQEVDIERRKDDSLVVVSATRQGVTWTVTGSFLKQDSGARTRFPGITVQWKTRPIGGAPSSKGTITVAQLEVLIGALGV